MRSAEELNKKLTASEQQCNVHFDRVKLLEYQLSEVIGCVGEYVDMPCHSLKLRMVDSVRRAIISTKSKGKQMIKSKYEIKFNTGAEAESGVCDNWYWSGMALIINTGALAECIMASRIASATFEQIKGR